MTTMNISLPGALKSFVDEQSASRDYDTSSEYVWELIRKNQDRQRPRGLLLGGAASAPASPADRGHFDRLRERVHRHREWMVSRSFRANRLTGMSRKVSIGA